MQSYVRTILILFSFAWFLGSLFSMRAFNFFWSKSHNRSVKCPMLVAPTQSVFGCSKLAIETLEQGVKYV